MATVTTEAQVANLALGLIGQRQLLDNLVTQTSTEAQVARNYFASTRNELLEAWHWRFATKRAALALKLTPAGVAVARDGWGYCYACPSDMLTAQRLWNGHREVGSGERIPFTIESDDDGTGLLLLTDLVKAKLFYTYEIKNPSLWPASFVRAVSAQLAVYFAGQLPVKPELMPNLQRAASIALQAAAARDANQHEPDAIADSEFIRER